jgi:hypothetical protein
MHPIFGMQKYLFSNNWHLILILKCQWPAENIDVDFPAAKCGVIMERRNSHQILKEGIDPDNSLYSWCWKLSLGPSRPPGQPAARSPPKLIIVSKI